MNITLIIATYNWPEALSLSLSKMNEQTSLPAEIIIADDGSDYRTKKVVDDFRAISSIPIIHLWHDDSGFRKTIILNRAISKASFKYIIQIDGDVVPSSKYFIEDHIRVAEKGCYIRGTRVSLNSKESTELLNKKKLGFTSVLQLALRQPVNMIRINPMLSPLFFRKEMSGRKVKGCNMAFWRDDLIKVNGYNSDLTGWGHEDEDISSRLVNLGVMKKIIKTTSVVYHIYHKEVSREEEFRHTEALKFVRDNGVIKASNGIKEL